MYKTSNLDKIRLGIDDINISDLIKESDETFSIIDDENTPSLYQLINFHSKHESKFYDLDTRVLTAYSNETRPFHEGDPRTFYKLYGELKLYMDTPLKKDLIIEAINQKKIRNIPSNCISTFTTIMSSTDEIYFRNLLKLIKRYSEIDLELKYAPGGTEYIKAEKRFEKYTS
tara:strand:- start:4063 stop:4578 length:516 start_codon:yes stop_codon:yes gene_type:complete